MIILYAFRVKRLCSRLYNQPLRCKNRLNCVICVLPYRDRALIAIWKGFNGTAKGAFSHCGWASFDMPFKLNRSWVKKVVRSVVMRNWLIINTLHFSLISRFSDRNTR